MPNPVRCPARAPSPAATRWRRWSSRRRTGASPQVIVNRVWKRYMGLGLVEPADDWSQAKPSHPELLRLPGARADDARLRSEAHRAAHLFLARLPAQAADGAARTARRKTASSPDRLRRNLTAEQLVDSLFLSVGKRIELRGAEPESRRRPRAVAVPQHGRSGARLGAHRALERTRPPGAGAAHRAIAGGRDDRLTAGGNRARTPSPRATTRLRRCRP